ncbi:MAG: GAF domain-containing protein [Candidatus Brocadiae bacterium]|nr:GAF domain-containing protein [Candidatus Brocadiia bacterium]
MKHPRKPAKRKAAPARKGGGKPRRADVASILLAINRRWLSSLDPAVLLPAIVQLTRESFDVSDTTLLLLGSNGQEFVQHLASGPHFHKLDQRFFQQIRDGGVTGWVATHRKPLIVNDTSKDKRYVGNTGVIKSELAVPVMAEGRLLGVLNLESNRLHDFKPADVKLLEMMADQCAIALRNAEIYEIERRRAQQCEVLYHISRIGGGVLPAMTVLQRAVEAISGLLECFYVSLFLGDYDREELVLMAQRARGDIDVVPGATQKFAVGLIGYAFRLGETVHVRDVGKNETYVARIPGVKSEICIPIRLGDRCLGILDAQSRKEDGFSPDEVMFLDTVARFLAPTCQGIELGSTRTWSPMP